MALPEIRFCPGNLNPGFETYCPAFRRRMFDGKQVSHILSFNRENDPKFEVQKMENRQRISISGVQEKYTLFLDRNKIRFPTKEEKGQYILKPIPGELENRDQIPANEHLTMQLARQVYGISTAENGLIFFADGEPAYITKRFDFQPDGSKKSVEDFASISGKSRQANGPDFKYEGSYEALAKLIYKYLPARAIETERFFQVVLFNYLFSNGDAHLKNFSIIETPQGDNLLSPAYDLLNTSLHVNDSRMALKKGLFDDDFETDSFKHNAFEAYDDFYYFGQKIGIQKVRLLNFLTLYRTINPQVEEFIKRSYLSPEFKQRYLESYLDRLKALNYSFEGRV